MQCFKWAMENDKWHARIGSIPQVFAAAAEDMGCSVVDKQVVKRVWDCLMPGLLEVRPLHSGTCHEACIACPSAAVMWTGRVSRGC